eukprot:10006115-Lingulodinium_polyedra.AAC.1
MHARGAAPPAAVPHHAVRAHTRPREACLVGATLGAPGVNCHRSDVREAKLVHVVTAARPDCVMRL